MLTFKGHWHILWTNQWDRYKPRFSIAINEGGYRGIVFNAIHYWEKQPYGYWFFYFAIGFGKNYWWRIHT